MLGRADAVNFGDPFRSGSDYFGSAGLDLKYRITWPRPSGWTERLSS